MNASRLLLTSSALFAAHSVAAQQLPPIRPLGAVVARSAEPFRTIAAVRHLPNGVLVNDLAARRVVLLDSALARLTVVADSTEGTATAYSGRMGGLIPYRGDSTLFVDPGSMTMLVIDPAGRLGRVMSVPRTQDALALTNTAFGSPAFDAAGRLVYRGMNRFQMHRPGNATPGAAPRPGAALAVPEQPDTAPVVRIDLATRKLDTLAFVKIPKIRMNVSQDSAGRVSMTSEVNPLPVVDEWAVMSDGSIAIVRGRDYHVDWIHPDGTLSSSPKMPFEWQRLTDEDKAAFIDSVKAARERMADDEGIGGPGGAPGGGGLQIVAQDRRVAAGGGPAPTPARGAGMRQAQLSFVAASELPDYKPPFFAGAVRADADGNLWIRTIPTKAIPGGPVYDVVNGRGDLVDRVQLPAGRTIAGFGPGGVVYLAARERRVVYLERANAR